MDIEIQVKEKDMKVELIKLADIPDHGSTIVPFFGRELHIYMSNGRPRAVANVCMHFGGPLECREGRLICPWHGAVFDMETGARLEGPAPASARLMTLSTRVDGDALFYVWGES
jgi:nitrite reductase/ring-hydroxylating ferredoxin subunit